MIERTAYLKLTPEHATPAGRRDLAQRALSVLRPLPGVAGMTVGVAADADTEGAWDLSIAVRFASAADAATYRAHPIHRRFVDEEVAPRCVARKAWSFVIETA